MNEGVKMGGVAYSPSEKAKAVLDYYAELDSEDVQSSAYPIWTAANRAACQNKVSRNSLLLWITTCRDDKHSAIARQVRSMKRSAKKKQ